MTITEFLAQSETSDAALAEAIGVSRQSLHRYKTGERRPEWDVLERLAKVTNGNVTPNDFIDVPRPAPAETEPQPGPAQGVAA